jgi:S-adenosylmethionine:tRNA ribosyltransferase-isomerase
MRTTDLDYELPTNLVAQQPLRERESSRLLFLSRTTKKWEDREFREFPDLLRGDELLVVNNARVIPARLFGFRRGLRAQLPGRRNPARHEFLTTQIEVLLTKQLSSDVWEALVRPGRKIPTGERIVFAEGELEAEVIGRGEYGVRQLRFSSTGRIEDAIERLGHVPLPPYINREDEPADRERYQTIFASQPGAVAAPTAGLHFSVAILERLRARGIDVVELTLRVGLGTFQPIHAETLEEHRMHVEDYEIPESTAAKINSAASEGRPVLAVGTTVVRALEDAAQKSLSRHNTAAIEPGAASADLFIYPGYEFRIVRQLLTNFHLPKSSLLAMVCAFASREFILDAYHHAVARGYRFYSYGDCMLIR